MASSQNNQDTVHPSSDPSIYHEYESKWSTLPSDSTGWIQRAKDVAAVLAPDAAAREKANRTPRAEVALLKHSGLLKILGPKEYGGGEQPWSVAYQAIREVAKGDGSIGMLLGYHLLWAFSSSILGTPSQITKWTALITSQNLFVGGAVNPRDSDLVITADPNHSANIIFNGSKHFTTGAAVSDLIVLEGSLSSSSFPESGGAHIFAYVPTTDPGITFSFNWDAIGLRLTESGSAQISNVVVSWEDALGWDASTKQPLQDILGVPFATLLLPTIQLVFTNFYLGIALAALDLAAAYTRKSTRPWPYLSGGERETVAPAEKATDEFYILSTYGTHHAHLFAATALVDRANERISGLFAAYAGNHTRDNRGEVTALQRGEISELIAAAKIVVTDVGLKVTSDVFEVTGSRATASKVGLDRFWRDLRTHTLHDPIAYKRREVGRWVLLGEIPTPTWYT
ncbi:acyl-CoA dehydrogenase/oxidase [Neurospora hispaniola]|uniref:Acyl-CoA dehydrogenase/oxidase n=1 Tax=Neurospora hispaniola TaxID=588809 RepID=A0AAJ0HYX8_9PEZI|nr:acyl-CoA dehydrogenase/oxidase [Neurospora hispaniola]